VSRPLIGICAAVERAQWLGWDVDATLLSCRYPNAVQRAEGIALLLPPDDAMAESPGELLDRLDALVLAGGADIDPATYGARSHAATTGSNPARDRFELALAWAALERDLPLLGICRGMQMLNVAAGGTIRQHLPDDVGHERHRETANVFGNHEVVLEPGSLAARAAGQERHAVRSYHHQGPGELGDGVVASGVAVEDGTTEAIELPDRRFALGVLWHPEEDEASGVIGALVAAARGAAVALPVRGER